MIYFVYIAENTHMNWRKFSDDYLSFSRKDRIGLLIIVLLVIGVFFLPKAIPHNSNSTTAIKDTAWIAAIKRLEQKNPEQTDRQYTEENSNYYHYDRRTSNYSDKSKGELFDFDPNSLSADGWARLGIREKTIHTIQNYLSKGGKFRKPEDLQRIYGLFPNEFERIAPYIKIESLEKTTGYTNYADNKNELAAPVKNNTPRYATVDINRADTTALIALPGIGSKLAARIITFREKLGGFYSVSQVGETFGLPDSTFQKLKQYLKAENISIRKLNINTVTIDELKMHPYIKWGIANPLISYRKEHGAFARLEDIKKVMVVTEEVYSKIAPYLTTN